ncbi:putative nucleotidyltransferase substrate binding domain-containing protein [Mycobacterium sp. OTB74]|uniref:putative nucleotidyltransferase substrate binding domain-containing protein n=1 Tax=Mycobacterium sp. OTB74 TaxID=1853452 RepID=UPI002474C84B|nr:putative nucleotidyltransferase substrate binding domain-containing protein [Mycobacterium sp. OTB74]
MASQESGGEQSAGIYGAVRRIDAAVDEATLRAGIELGLQSVRDAARAQVSAVDITAGWSRVLRGSIAAAVRLTAVDLPWTWFVSGSVARGEAMVRSDVETLIVLADSADQDADQRPDHANVLARAAEVHALLERCGVRADANGVLASRRRFCRTNASWLEGIARWAADPWEDRGVVMTGILADARAVTGPSDDLLRAQVVRAARANYPVRQYMLQDATTLRAVFPSRLRMLTNQSDTVDLKLAAFDPLVKIARWAALSAGSTAVSTLDRLDAAGSANVLDDDDVSSLKDCFTWLLRFRWTSRTGDSVVVSQLPPKDRATLRSVAREVAGVSRKLTYLASTSAFR